MICSIATFHTIFKFAATSFFNLILGAFAKKIPQTDATLSNHSLNHAKILAHSIQSFTGTLQNSDNGISTSKPLDVRKIKTPGLNLDDHGKNLDNVKTVTANPSLVRTDENTKLKQEVEKDFKKANRILTEKADLIQNGAYHESSFDIGSFVGGMVLVIVFNVICVFGVRYYKMRGSRNYNYLLWGESNA